MIPLNENNKDFNEDDEKFQQLSITSGEEDGFSPEDLDFETALEKLEDIVDDLEGDMLSLEESVEKFTLGLKLIKYCQEELDRAEGKIEQVVEEHGELKEIIPFEWPQEEV